MATPESAPETTAQEWLARFAAEIDVEAPTAEDVDTILDLAGAAAHSSERKAAPVACWLAAAAGLGPRDALRVAERLSEG